MTTPREHVTPDDFLCEKCGGAGFVPVEPNNNATERCWWCRGSGMDLELLADLYNDLSAAVREVQARTDGDER